MRQEMHAVSLLLSVIVFLSSTAYLSAFPVPENLENGDEVHVELIRHLADHRVKRDLGTSLMPDVLVMKFSLGVEDVVLRLRRTRYPPVFAVTGQGATRVTGLGSDLRAVYIDPSRSASFVVRQADNGNFVLDGNLKHAGQYLLMSPIHRRRRSTDNNSNSNSSSSRNNNMHFIVVPPQVLEYDHGAIGEKDNGQVSQAEQGTTAARKKRETDVAQHVIETAFVIDHTDYDAWKTRYPTNTMGELRDYYTYIAQTLNNIYASVKEVDSSIDIKVAVTSLYVVESSGTAILNSSSGVVEGTDYLDDFLTWIPNNLPSDAIPSDHYMAFTAYDILFNANTAVGVARSAQVCKSSSVSVVENAFRASVANVAAHELGHALSAPHDGDTKAKDCSPSKQNVMTPTFFVPPVDDAATDSDLFTFSSCSVSFFKSYLASQTCTDPSTTSADLELPFQDYNKPLITNRTRQCQEAVDSSSYFCDPSDFPSLREDQICVGMLCRINSDVENVISCTYVLPFEGTSCGSGKICSRGLCVNESSAVQASQIFIAAVTEPLTTATPTTPAPITPAPTTPAPTTPAPTTPALTTPAPTTPVPTTPAPTTPAPTATTPAPTAPAPTTPAPTTPRPTTPALTTPVLTTPAPTTPAPTTPAATTPAPTTPAPTTPAPTTPAPTTPAPTATTPAPTAPAPTTPAPTTPAPTTPALTTPAPTTPAPTTPAATTPAPTTPAPTTLAPTTPALTTPSPTTPAPTSPPLTALMTTPAASTPTPTTPALTTPMTTPAPTTPTLTTPTTAPALTTPASTTPAPTTTLAPTTPVPTTTTTRRPAARCRLIKCWKMFLRTRNVRKLVRCIQRYCRRVLSG